jgi:hypothetical protein
MSFSNYLMPKLRATAQQPQAAASPVENVGLYWWILPIVLTWLGGVISFLVLRKKNFKTARNMLIVGIVWAVIIIPTLSYLFGFFFFGIL